MTDEASYRGLRAALAQRQRLVGTFLMIPRVEIVEMLAAAGFDAVLVDLEHGAIEVSDLMGLAAAAQGSGMYAIARLASSEEHVLARALDAGVDGVLVPHVSSAEEARRLVRAGRFPPAGDRSLNPYVRGLRYDRGKRAGREEANRRVALLAMVEGADAVRQLDDICAVDGLDGVFVGPVDLSASLGVPGEPEHPLVVEEVGRIFSRVAELDVASGIYAPTAEAAARWFRASASLVALSADVAMAVREFTATRAAVVEAVGGPATRVGAHRGERAARSSTAH